MPIQQTGSTSGAFYRLNEWTRSPRINGVLTLKSNPMKRLTATLEASSPHNTGKSCVTSNVGYSEYWQRGMGNTHLGKDLWNTVRRRFVDKAWSDAQASLAVDLAEGRQSLRMIGDALLRLAGAAIAVRRGQFRSASRILGVGRDPPDLIRVRKVNGKLYRRNGRPIPPGITPSEVFANNWLAYRYGWSPFYSSIYSLAQVLEKPVENRFVRVSASMPISQSYWTNVRGGQAKTLVTNTGTIRMVVKASVVVSNPTLATLQQYGVANPALVAWESVPFSFVADWFLPIGSFLESLTDMLGLRMEDGSVTEHCDCACTYEFMHPGFPGIPQGAFYRNYVTYKTRYLVSSLPGPNLSWFSNGLNPKRLLDSISLLRSALR